MDDKIMDDFDFSEYFVKGTVSQREIDEMLKTFIFTNVPKYKVGEHVVHTSVFNSTDIKGELIPEYIIITSVRKNSDNSGYIYNGYMFESDFRTPTDEELKSYFIS